MGLKMAIMSPDVFPALPRRNPICVKGDPRNYDDVMNFGQEMDVIRVDNEEVDTNALRALRDMGVSVFPSPETIELIQDKVWQKNHLREFKIPVVKDWLVSGKFELTNQSLCVDDIVKSYVDENSGKAVLKIQTLEDVMNADGGSVVAESVVTIRQQITVLVSRSASGLIECFDPIFMLCDKEQMYVDYRIASAGLSEDSAISVGGIAKQVAEAIDLTGIVAIEMFIAQNGRIYVNEISLTSQTGGCQTLRQNKMTHFEHQLRTLLALPVGKVQQVCQDASLELEILEPAAYLRYVTLEALKTILSISEMHLSSGDKSQVSKLSKIRQINMSETYRTEAISKSLLIRHILNDEYAYQSFGSTKK